MKLIHILTPDGTGKVSVEVRSVEKQPTLEELQKIVGGWIERVEVLFKGQERDMIINEEGLIKRLPFNPAATEYRTNWLTLNGLEQYATPIVGTVVIFEGFALS